MEFDFEHEHEHEHRFTEHEHDEKQDHSPPVIGESPLPLGVRPDVWKFVHPEFVRTYRTEERRDAATRTRQTRAQRRLGNARKQSAR